MVDMSERTVCNGLVRSLRRELPGCVVLRHTDGLLAGIPDISVTWNGHTTWIEVKFLNPKIIDRGIQRLNMKRLEKQGTAFYVLYDNIAKHVFIVKPSSLDDYRDVYWRSPGFNHTFVSVFVRRIHEEQK